MFLGSFLHSQASRLLAQGDNEKAVMKLDRLLKICPDFGTAYNDRGVAQLNLQRYDSALRDLQVSAELLPENAIVLANLRRDKIAKDQ